MARPSTTEALTPSIFDRLLDYDPQRQVEVQSSRNQIIRDLRESVRRDLEYLLNTRQSCEKLASKWDNLKYSVINFGIPDYTGANLSNEEDRVQFAKLIEKIILANETRFKTVSIKVLSTDNTVDRTFRFRIDALLKVEPAVKPVVFDSSLEPVTRNFFVRDIESG